MELRLQRLLRAIYPDQCLSCDALTDRSNALCAACWSEARFIFGSACDACGAPMQGETVPGGDLCDACVKDSPIWAKGRAAISYEGLGKRLVLGMKYGDKPGHARPFARWMARAGADILEPDTLLVPVPLHWTRLAKRRFNQSAELARALMEITGFDWCPDALVRTKRTPALKDATKAERTIMLANAISANSRRIETLRGRRIVLVDDVLTTGTTLTLSAHACFDAGAAHVSVLVLARAGKPA